MYPLRRTGLVNQNKIVSGWPFANVLTVSQTDLDADHSTIAAAITAASAGDIIEIDPGTYTEILTVNKAITLRGRDRDNTTITSSTAFSIVVSLTAVGAKLLNLKITHTGTGLSDICVLITANDCVIENCILEKSSASNTGVGIENTSGTGLIVRESEITISGGTAFNRCYGGNTAASDVEFIRCVLNCSGTSSSEISLNHANAVVTITETILTNGTVTIAANNGTFQGTLQDAILVKNVSGDTAVFNDVGYLDEAGEYQTTTQEADDVAWCVVVIGNDDDDNIFVKRRGNVVVNYIDAAPAADDFLVTSTTAGSGKQQTTMRPEIFAVATAAGAGGKVQVQLLTESETRYFTSVNDMLRIETLSDTDFMATIKSFPGADTVEYNPPTSGADDTIDVLSTSQDGKIILHNTDDSNSNALISDTNTGTDVITLTAPTPGTWNIGDAIQARSLTATGAVPGGGRLYDLDLSGLTTQLKLARALILDIQYKDTGAPAGNLFGGVFKFDTFTGFSEVNNQTPQTNAFNNKQVEVALLDEKITFTCGASGVATGSIILRVRGAIHASP